MATAFAEISFGFRLECLVTRPIGRRPNGEIAEDIFGLEFMEFAFFLRARRDGARSHDNRSGKPDDEASHHSTIRLQCGHDFPPVNARKRPLAAAAGIQLNDPMMTAGVKIKCKHSNMLERF
jgi:hypothetical protein